MSDKTDIAIRIVQLKAQRSLLREIQSNAEEVIIDIDDQIIQLENQLAEIYGLAKKQAQEDGE